jgi:hypothetical protein
MSLFRTKKTKVMLIIFGLFIQQPTNPGCFESFVKLYLHSSEQQTNIASVKVFQASFADWYLFIQDRIFNVLRRVVITSY